MWASILGIIEKLLGVFFPAPPTPEATAEKVGEVSGKAQVEAATAQEEVKDVKIANDARESVRVNAITHPDRILSESDGFRRD